MANVADKPAITDAVLVGGHVVPDQAVLAEVQQAGIDADLAANFERRHGAWLRNKEREEQLAKERAAVQKANAKRAEEEAEGQSKAEAEKVGEQAYDAVTARRAANEAGADAEPDAPEPDVKDGDAKLRRAHAAASGAAAVGASKEARIATPDKEPAKPSNLDEAQAEVSGARLARAVRASSRAPRASSAAAPKKGSK